MTRKKTTKKTTTNVTETSNSGIGNSGYYNSGDCNSGDRNSGIGNSGDRNSGDRNSGDYNSGIGNSCDRNSGDRNSGYGNSGDCNSGDYNSGYYNSGDGNSGDYNSGDCNSGDYNSGLFNTNEPKMRLFNRECEYTYSEFAAKFGYRTLNPTLTEWILSTDMTDAEKAAHPSHEITGGYLKTFTYKEAWSNAWNNANDEQKRWFLSLPNFDADIFFEITGIRVRAARAEFAARDRGDDELEEGKCKRN